MTRITKALAETIAKAVAVRTYASKISDAEHAINKYGRSIVAELTDQTFLMSLPGGTVPEVCGVSHSAEPHGYYYIRFMPLLRVPYTFKNSTLNTIPAEKIGRYKDLALKLQELKTEFETEQNTLACNILAFGTVKRLLNEWPEIESFVPEYAKNPQSRAVAVPVMALNKKFDLPPEVIGRSNGDGTYSEVKTDE